MSFQILFHNIAFQRAPSHPTRFPCPHSLNLQRIQVYSSCGDRAFHNRLIQLTQPPTESCLIPPWTSFFNGLFPFSVPLSRMYNANLLCSPLSLNRSVPHLPQKLPQWNSSLVCHTTVKGTQTNVYFGLMGSNFIRFSYPGACTAHLCTAGSNKLCCSSELPRG